MYEDRNSTTDTINRLDIPKMLVAKATGFDPRKVSDFVKGRPLPEPEIAKIKDAVRKLEFVWTVFAPYKIFFDSPELLESAFESATVTKRNREFPELALAELQLEVASLDIQKMFSEVVHSS